MRRLAMKALDADHIPWLYLFASFILLEAAAHADNHVKLGFHWLAYAAPVGIAAGALAAASAALQHHKLQMFTSAMVLAFIGADTPNPHRFPGLQVSHVLYVIGAMSLAFMLVTFEREWGGTNWLRWRAKRTVPAVVITAAICLLAYFRDSLLGAVVCAAVIVAALVWYDNVPSEVDYRGEMPRYSAA
ncbi:MAG TPA: hypothetical protein VFJ84_01065 [Candidatus Saccharimonadales bacterium]|nr:hypothetical protein [Candidatus Saccharimonadales bacterium]